MSHQRFMGDFSLKLEQVKNSPNAAIFSDEYTLLSHIMNACTCFAREEIIYKNIKSRLDPIFTRSALEQAEASGMGSMDTMTNICNSAKRLMLPDFIKFVEAVAEDHFHVAEKLMETLDSLVLHVASPPHFAGISACQLTARSSPSSDMCRSSRPGSAVSPDWTISQRVSGTETVSAFQDNLSPLYPPSNFSEFKTPPSSFSPYYEHLANLGSNGSSASSDGYISPENGGRLTQNQRQPSSQPPRHLAQQSKVYDMSRNPRGLALVINNENFDYWNKRLGSGEDVKKLYSMFKYLGFLVRTEHDKTAQEMKTLLQHFSQHPSLCEVSCLAVVVMTHGGFNDCWFGTEGQMRGGQPVEGTFVTKLDIIHMFKGSACRSMEGKPKLFILQACRGAEENIVHCSETNSSSASFAANPPCSMRSDDPFGASASTPGSGMNPSQTSTTVSSAPSPRPHWHKSSARVVRPADTADMCFVHSSSYGYKAYRTRTSGSPFIEVFSQTVRQLAYHKEFRDIIQEIQKKFNSGPLANDMMTLPDFSLQLVRKWFLNPPKWANAAQTV